MAKAGLADDNIFGDSVIVEKPKLKRGRQEDGTWITASGEVLPAKNRMKRDPYPEPESAQVDGHEETVETPKGDLSFLAVRMNDQQFRKANFLERKRQKCLYMVTEIYAGKPRPYYSYDELEQLRRGEMVR